MMRVYNAAATLENSLAVSQKVKKINISDDSAILLSGIYPREMKTPIHTKT